MLLIGLLCSYMFINICRPQRVVLYSTTSQSEEETSEPSEDELENEQDVVSITHRIIVQVYNDILR